MCVLLSLHSSCCYNTCRTFTQLREQINSLTKEKDVLLKENNEMLGMLNDIATRVEQRYHVSILNYSTYF
jgi:predicted nuclease with TOPRIM domain